MEQIQNSQSEVDKSFLVNQDQIILFWFLVSRECHN
jgi:hypothetical protein